MVRSTLALVMPMIFASSAVIAETIIVNVQLEDVSATATGEKATSNVAIGSVDATDLQTGESITRIVEGGGIELTVEKDGAVAQVNIGTVPDDTENARVNVQYNTVEARVLSPRSGKWIRVEQSPQE